MRPAGGFSLVDILLAYGALQIDDALVFQLTEHSDDLLLGSFDLANLDGAKDIHVFEQHCSATLGHGGEEVVAQLFSGAFEGDGEQLAVYAGEEFLDADFIDHEHVLEDKHELANALGELRIDDFQRLEEFFAGAGIEAVEHFGDGLDAASGLAAEVADFFELEADDIGDLADDIGRDLFETGHAVGDVGA